MTVRVTLTLTEAQHAILRRHLFPRDGREAAAVALCGRHGRKDGERLLVHRIEPIHEDGYTARTREQVSWKTAVLVPLLEEAARRGLGLVKIHSHPSGFAAFSPADDRADEALFPSVQGWIGDGRPHASAIMLPDGRVFGRAHPAEGGTIPLEHVAVIGDNITIWRSEQGNASAVAEAGVRNAQAFGAGTYHALRNLRVAVVGCSGTGSVAVELLARLMVGELVLIDPDLVEAKNLNRILGATQDDVGRPKVDVLQACVTQMGLGTRVESHAAELSEPSALHAVGGADVVFGCVDSVDGRHLLNRIATFFTLPYFDVGVKLEADGAGGIEQICGSVHYLRPGGSSLRTRGLYTDEQLRAANLRRADPELYASELNEKYIAGIDEDRPAVCPVNMLFSARAVLEFLARLHPFRHDENALFAIVTESLAGMFTRTAADGEPDAALARCVGRGDTDPPLGLPLLSMPATE